MFGFNNQIRPEFRLELCHNRFPGHIKRGFYSSCTKLVVIGIHCFCDVPNQNSWFLAIVFITSSKNIWFYIVPSQGIALPWILNHCASEEFFFNLARINNTRPTLWHLLLHLHLQLPGIYIHKRYLKGPINKINTAYLSLLMSSSYLHVILVSRPLNCLHLFNL